MTITTLPIDQIRRNERQPREYFEPNALQELADSIKRFGLMQPIEVRRDGDQYEIVAGERRWRAHQLAELTEIKVIVTDGNLTEMERFKRSVAENINRADMTPMEEARAFSRILKEQEGAEAKDVAKEFGKSPQYVMLRLALLDLTEEVQQHVNSGAIGTQAAVQIAALTPGNQAAVLKKWAGGAFAGDNELVHFAYALKRQQNQVVAMIVENMSPEERQRERATTRKNIDRVEQVLGLLDELAKADPMKLAIALEGEVAKRLDQMDRVADAVAKARFNMRQAKAHAEAREVARLNPDAEHQSPAAKKAVNRPKAPAKTAPAEAVTPKPEAPAKRVAPKPAAPVKVAAPKPKAPTKRIAAATV